MKNKKLSLLFISCLVFSSEVKADTLLSNLKPYDFKAGIGLDYGHTGLQIGAMANFYKNLTPVSSLFVGADIRYNVMQNAIKQKLRQSTPNTIIPVDVKTTNKMDILFKFGAKFKLDKNISLSPYALLGTGFGAVKQQSGVYETLYERKSTTQYNRTITNKEYVETKQTTIYNNAPVSFYSSDLHGPIYGSNISDIIDSHISTNEIDDGNGNTLYQVVIHDLRNNYPDKIIATVDNEEEAFDIRFDLANVLEGFSDYNFTTGRYNSVINNTYNKTETITLDSNSTTVNEDSGYIQGETKTGNYSKTRTNFKESFGLSNKQQFYFKGGLGLEIAIKDRFFARFEYKLSRLEAQANKVKLIKKEQTNNYQTNKTTTYDRYITNTNYITYDQYVKTYTDYPINNDTVYDPDGIHEAVKEYFRDPDSPKVAIVDFDNNPTSSTEGPITTNKQTSQNSKTEFLGTTLDNEENLGTIKTKKENFYMHEISFGFGFYFL